MVIIIRPRHIERFFSILIILVLAILLIMSYVNNSCSKDDQQDANSNNPLQENQTTNNTLENSTQETTKNNVDVIEETCSDGLKNQDETNIDCGGTCTSTKGAYYYDAECHKTKETSIATSLKIKSVGYSGGSSTSAKLESVTIDISNGEGKNELFTLEVYVLDRYGSYYLNQLDGSYKGDPFASMTLVVADQQVITNKLLPLQNVASPYLLQNDYYSSGEPFMVEIVLKNRLKEVVKDVKSSVITP